MDVENVSYTDAVMDHFKEIDFRELKGDPLLAKSRWYALFETLEMNEFWRIVWINGRIYARHQDGKEGYGVTTEVVEIRLPFPHELWSYPLFAEKATLSLREAHGLFREMLDADDSVGTGYPLPIRQVNGVRPSMEAVQ